MLYVTIYIYIMLPYKHYVGCQGWHRVVLGVMFQPVSKSPQLITGWGCHQHAAFILLGFGK